MNVNNVKNTIEFRLSNGTLDPNVWIENVRLYGRIVQMAHELGQIKIKLKNEEKLTEHEREKLYYSNILKTNVTNDEKMDALMKILFSEEERKVYDERYTVNKELEAKEHVIEKMKSKFGIIDFEQVYENTEIGRELIENLRRGQENEYSTGSVQEK